jgi:hypothetical protein
MPAALILVLQGIQAALGLAPQVEAVAISAKSLISALFAAKLISAEQQNALHAWVDSHAQLAAAGIVPPAWQVQPDPVAITAAPQTSGTAAAPAPSAASPESSPKTFLSSQ